MAGGDDRLHSLLSDACEDVAKEQDQTCANDPGHRITDPVQHVAERAGRAGETERLSRKEERDEENDPERCVTNLRADRRLVARRVVRGIGAASKRCLVDQACDAPLDRTGNQPTDKQDNECGQDAWAPLLRIENGLVSEVAGAIGNTASRIS